MVPLRDENPIRITPYVTYGLIAINVVIFLYEWSLSPEQLNALFYHWALVPARLTVSLNTSFPHFLGEATRLISAQFLHAGFLHLGGNMLYLWIFGNNLEEDFGRIKFLLFYLVCGLLAALVQWWFDPLSEIPSLGASGAIAGVMGAYVFRYPKVRIITVIPIFLFYFFTVRIPAVLFLGFWFIQQALYGVASLEAPATVGMEGGGIAYWAHAGGFVIGAVIAWFLGLFEHHLDYNEGGGRKS
ncbi:MAG: rhomboid family intramembrane serine protease [Synechococcales cyanobacterium RM1_1_8]|nr:rhomboid family intramembrane serine protease [Synechococcales cyanobacterium RM1_1_8]